MGLIVWSLLPSQQFHISCHSLRMSSLARGRKSMADTLTGDIGSERAPFATLSALSFPGIPTWPGIQQIYDCFTRVCESAVGYKIFIDCILVNMTSSQRSQTGIRVWEQEKVFFFRSSDNIQGKQDSVKFRIEDACCTRQPISWRTAFMAQGCRNSVAHFRTVSIDMIEIFKAVTELVLSDFKNLRRSGRNR